MAKKMDAPFDPNVPDTSDGNFFCSLCLATMNSENMWSAHIVGKRHIKNSITFPNGLPEKRKFFDDEDSYERPPKMDRFRDDDIPPTNHRKDYFYDDQYYDVISMPYVPEVRPNVVFDYGHRKIQDVIKPADSKKLISDAANSDTEKAANLDEILKEISKSEAKRNGMELEPVADDFFQKINERELARDIAQDLAKSRFLEKIQNITKDPSVPGPAGTSQKEQNKTLLFKKHGKRSTSDIIDILHKYNDERLFKISDDEDDKSSSLSIKQEKKSALKLLDKVDPDNLSHDMLDDLLNSYIKPKIDSVLKEKTASLKIEPAEPVVNLNDPEVIAQKFEALPTKVFLQLTQKKLKTLDLTDSDEIQMLLQIISQAQEVVFNKLPPHLLAVVKAKMSGNDPMKTEGKVQSVPISQSFSVVTPPMQTQAPNVPLNCTITSTSSQILSTVVPANYSVPQLPAAMWTRVSQGVAVPPIPPPPFVNSSILKNFPVPATTSNSNFAIPNISDFKALMHAAMSTPGRFPVPTGAPLNSTANLTAHPRMPGDVNSYNQMLSMYKNRPGVPSVTSAVRPPPPPACPPPALSQQNFSFSNNMQAALDSLQKMSDDFVSKKKSEEALKESEKGPNKESERLSKDLKNESKQDVRKDFREDSRDNYKKDSKDNYRKESREDYKKDPQDSHRRDSRDDYKKDSQDNYRRDSRENYRRDSRRESRWS